MIKVFWADKLELTDDKQSKRKVVNSILRLYLDDNSLQGTLAKLEYEKNGKPLFNNGEFGLSYAHSRDVVVAAVSLNEKNIGIDLEHSSRQRQLLGIKQLAFSKTELKNHKNPHELLGLWTLKEAALKLKGVGFYNGEPSAYTILPKGPSFSLIYSGKTVLNAYFMSVNFRDFIVTLCSKNAESVKTLLDIRDL